MLNSERNFQNKCMVANGYQLLLHPWTYFVAKKLCFVIRIIDKNKSSHVRNVVLSTEISEERSEA